jgi:integrase
MVKRLFKWGVAEELVPPAVYQSLVAVAGLERGRTLARESEPVRPIRDEDVDAALPFLNRHVAGLVEFQRLTGCRPGEACAVRRCDLDTGGAVWLFRPPHHKTAWKGKSRVIAIGPRAQALLKEFFTPNLNDYLFSPARAVSEFRVARGANRKTPLYPSHAKHNANRRAKNPGRRYSHAIDRACDRAFPPVGDLARREKESVVKWWARLTPQQREKVKDWRKSRRWHPNQLRHSFATKARKAHGLEAAQVLLGHSRADVTQVYAERNEQLAATVAAKIG